MVRWGAVRTGEISGYRGSGERGFGGRGDGGSMMDYYALVCRKGGRRGDRKEGRVKRPK